MKDEQQSTQVNAEADASDADASADALRIALGRRLRMARTSLGLSQQAVADAMRERGFNWRQTTVAKTEAADRPTLFTEVVALSSVLKRELNYFLSGRTALDEIREEAEGEVKRLETSLAAAKSQAMHLESQLKGALIVEASALTISNFSRHLDTSELLHSFDLFARSREFSVPRLKRVLEAAGVPVAVIDEMDEASLRIAAREIKGSKEVDRGSGSALSGQDLSRFAESYLNGKVTPSFFLDILRGQRGYRESASRAIIDEVIARVEPREVH
ncbi:hypothetical protein NFX46_02075 [Streptomyces phaeoluteigriseus]|uniref:HTH cro/C1-type domain-containing protein n=1 Tax=Streptomyces phaeoluteigriseus TaxID=114686 RepID=A0ABY4Z0T3_9ACTN|nr:hypothetical protein [Streptomyces phaeoluteigriseus]USQ82663.1 hypothetical protein NFX46_02075 [Streptomyces phaeoluteigriseus]